MEERLWGRCFEIVYNQQAMNHVDYKTTCYVLFFDKNKPYIAASPDGMFSFKCNESYVIENKCPFKFRGQFIKQEISDRDFLKVLDGTIHLKKSHKYYAQVVSSRFKLCLFHCSNIKGYVFWNYSIQ